MGPRCPVLTSHAYGKAAAAAEGILSSTMHPGECVSERETGRALRGAIIELFLL